MHPKEIRIEDYTYELPDERIAQHPLENRDGSKLLYLQKDGRVNDLVFKNLPTLFEADDYLVFNETRVIRARLIFPRGEGMKPIEIFCLDPHQSDIESAMTATTTVDFKCMVGNAKKWKDIPLQWLDENGNTLLSAEKLGREQGAFIVRFTWNNGLHFAAVLEALGHIPLPPYMQRPDTIDDANRYQTVYATRDGSVAAPTAGLHFTERVLKDIEAKGGQLGRVVLHVGAGTFKPVSSDKMEDHDMHSEAFEVNLEVVENILTSGRLTAVGTTSCRTLESLYWVGAQIANGQKVDLNNVFVDQWEPYSDLTQPSTEVALTALLNLMKAENTSVVRGRTQIIIAPGYNFKVVQRLITNFHQPGSTLILLVAAAIGPKWKEIYQHALNSDYRFLSYGDSSILSIS